MNISGIKILVLGGIAMWISLMLMLSFIDFKLADVNAHLTTIQELLEKARNEN